MFPIEFANPWLLWGLPVAALPILIHLFHRKRARPHPFAAIHFVLRSERRSSRRLRLRRLLLFAVRTLILLAVPVALARPQARRSDAAAAASRGPRATAFVLDASMSMSYRRTGRTLFERARDMLGSALAQTGAEEPVTYLGCTKEFEPPRAPSFDRAEVRRKIDAEKPTLASSDLTKCLAAAARALGDSPLKGKRIFVATDLTAAAFHLDIPAPVVRTPEGEVRPEVVLLDAAEEDLVNRALTDLSVEPAPAVGHRAYQFTFTVRNFSPEPVRDLTALLKVGGDVVSKGFVDLPAKGSAQKALTFQFREGGVFEGEVQIASDDLDVDDRRSFVVRVPREVKALVVNGSPSPVRFRDEVFFVEAALTAPGSPVTPTFRDSDTAADEDFSQYDAVFLHNVRELTAARTAELARFVEKGGGLFVSLGDQVDPDRWEAGLGKLLPRALHVVKTAAERGTETAHKSAARFGSIDFGHPAFSVFTGEARAGFLGSRTYRYFLLRPGADTVKVLATFDDGAPAFAESSRGRGRVLVFTSTVDRDWSDWPIQPSFLPAIQRLASYLARLLDEREAKSVVAGDPLDLEPPPGVEPTTAAGPDGTSHPVRRGPRGPFVSDTQLPGAYRVRGRVGPESDAVIPEMGFSVHVDPRESDLTRLEERELVAYFGEGTRTDSAGGKGQRQREIPAWTALLALAVAAFLVEGALLRR